MSEDNVIGEGRFPRKGGDNVVEAEIETTLDIPFERVLEAEEARELTTGLVIGWSPDGSLYFASSTSRIGDVLLMLEYAKDMLLEEARK